MPAPPRMPQPPNLYATKANTSWWRFWQHKREQERQLHYEAHALERYEKQFDRYTRRLDHYEEAVMTYPERMAAYEVELAAWEAAEEEAYARWCTEVRDKALRDHQRLLQEMAERGLFGTEEDRAALARWEALRDSTLAAMVALREKQMSAWSESVDNGAPVRMDGLQAFVVTTGRLGWINVDRFYDMPGSMTRNLLVHDGGPAEKQVALLFTDTRSLLQLKRTDNGTYTQTIPRDAAARVVAYGVENGRPVVCLLDVPEEGPLRLEFEPSSLKEIARLLSGLEEGAV